MSNCQKFEEHLLDLASDRVENESIRATILRHASDCPVCASRLADQQKLVMSLRALSSNMAVEKASDQVEQALRREFRTHVGPMKAARAANANPGRTSSRRTSTWIALAASVLLLIGWGLVQLNRESRMDRSHVVPAPKPVTDSAVKPSGPASTVTPEKPSRILPRPVRRVRTRPPQSPKPVAEQRVQVAARTSGQTRRLQSEDVTPDRVETEFLPFMAVGSQFPSEQRQFVRVKLPRSALQFFGLPMNMERLREPVQADVLLGEDGRALAVRFVKD